jgi:hypothetical protein
LGGCAIDSALIQSQSVILIVGPRWLRCIQERTARPEIDYHLRELTMALDRGIPVNPVRVHSAAMPDLADLPEELRARLPAVQWMEVYEDLFAASMQRIIADIEHSTGLISPTAYLPDHVSVVLINTSSSACPWMRPKGRGTSQSVPVRGRYPGRPSSLRHRKPSAKAVACSSGVPPMPIRPGV